MIQRKNTKTVYVKNVGIGSGNAISVQSMTNVPTKNVDDVLQQIFQLHRAGCDIVRVAVFDKYDCCSFAKVVEQSPLPVVADIHFNGDFAIKCLESGGAKIRINPSNMPQEKLDSIIDCAKQNGAAIRIGVNGGSPDKRFCHLPKNEALLSSLKYYVDYFEKRNFFNIVLSAKCSSVDDTVEINQALSSTFEYPLHIGLTEAGILQTGIVKNTLCISRLLYQGIGDTLRVSLTAHPVEEVRVCRTILKSMGLLKGGVEFISCPKCGRCQIDLEKTAEAVYQHVCDLDVNLTVAVMGCEVNGPGECACADIGLAGGAKVSFFKKGKIYKRVNAEEATSLFLQEIDLLVKDVRTKSTD